MYVLQESKIVSALGMRSHTTALVVPLAETETAPDAMPGAAISVECVPPEGVLGYVTIFVV
jgi:hypothetical protein